MLPIGSLGAIWAWWGKQFHEPKCGSGHVCRVMAWTRRQSLVWYIGFEKVIGDLWLFVAASHKTRLDTWSKARRPSKVGIKGRGMSGTSWSMLLIGSLVAIWALLHKQFHEPRCVRHVCWVMAWTRHQVLVPYIGFENAAHRLTWCNVNLLRQAVSRIQMCYLCLFVTASHQTRLVTWSKARSPIKVGIKRRWWSGTSRDLNPAGLCCSWILIRYIQYATTGTALCHPQNSLCRCDALFRSRHLALISPLGHFNGDNACLSPNHQTHKTQGDSKVYFLQRQTRLSLNYGEHHPSHVWRYVLPSQLSHNSISSPYSQSFLKDLQHKKAN